MHDRWDEMLRSKLSEGEADVPPAVWRNIRQNLDKPKRRFPLWIPAVAAGFLIMILVTRLRPEQHAEAPISMQMLPGDNTETVIPDTAKPQLPQQPAETPAPVKNVFASQGHSVRPRSPKNAAAASIEHAETLAVNCVEPPPVEKRGPEQSPVIPAPEEDLQPLPVVSADLITTDRILQETETAVKPVITNLVNFASGLLGLDAGIEEKVENDKHAVVMNADLGFFSIKRKSTYRK